MNGYRRDYNPIKDSSGFSLVELIICVAILAIATIPLMSAFSTSGNVIGRAQSMQNATSVAESIMEEIKGSSIEQLKSNAEYTYKDEDPAVYTYTTFNALGDAAKITYGQNKLEGKKGVLIQQAKTPFYVFFRTDVKSNAEAASSDGEKFDVVATIDASERYNSSSDGSDGTAADANSIELPVIERIDKGKHAVISKEINRLDASAVDTWKNNYRDKHHMLLSESVTITSMTKEVKITITGKDNDPDPTKHETDVDCEVIYYNTDEGSSDPCRVSEKVYSGTFLGASDSRVYLFYQTAIQVYHSNHSRRGAASCPADELVIDNENLIIKNITDIPGGTRKAPRQVYLMMQEDDVYPKSDTNYYQLNAGNTKVTITADDGSGVEKKATQNNDLSSDGILESANKSLLVITNLPNTAGTKTHFYYNKKDDYIYEIDVCVFDKSGKERAHLTSTKDAEKTLTPTPAPTPTTGP